MYAKFINILFFLSILNFEFNKIFTISLIAHITYLHEKDNFIEIFTNLAKYRSEKIILSNHRNNYVRTIHE